MDQMELFGREDMPDGQHRPDTVPIRSGRVGPIYFGATEVSFDLTQAVLTELAASDTGAGGDTAQECSN